MSFREICATRDPSTNSTKEWMTDWGWRTTSIREGGRPKRKCASMTSRPLFIMVAESIEIFGPIFHVGCASASSTVIAPNVWRSRWRSGPPEPVSTMRRTSSRVPHRSAWWMALCSESIGRISAPVDRADAIRSSPGDDEGFLVRQREALAGGHCRVRRTESDRSDESRDDEVRLRQRRRLFEARRARRDAAPEARRKERPQAGNVLLPLDRDEVGLVPRDLLREAVERPPGGERDDAEPVGESGDDVERCPADRAGRAENADCFHEPSIIRTRSAPGCQR